MTRQKQKANYIAQGILGKHNQNNKSASLSVQANPIAALYLPDKNMMRLYVSLDFTEQEVSLHSRLLGAAPQPARR